MSRVRAGCPQREHGDVYTGRGSCFMALFLALPYLLRVLDEGLEPPKPKHLVYSQDPLPLGSIQRVRCCEPDPDNIVSYDPPVN